MNTFDKGKGKREKGKRKNRAEVGHFFLLPFSLFLAAIAAGCEQEMAKQPSYTTYEPSSFFADGQSARPLPAGTFAREWARDDDPLTSGLTPAARKANAQPVKVKGQATPAATVQPAAPSDPAKYMNTFPFPMSLPDLERGQERFTIFCTACHGPLGNGNGKIVERGYVRPPNYHTDASRGFARFGKQVPLREVPVGYFFEVITHGYGAMPRYGPQIPPGDRWRIAAYVRALQLSQHADASKLPAPVRAKLEGQP
jgi:mono/diheme cytochrome c family protein